MVIEAVRNHTWANGALLLVPLQRTKALGEFRQTLLLHTARELEDEAPVELEVQAVASRAKNKTNDAWTGFVAALDVLPRTQELAAKSSAASPVDWH